MWKRGQRRANRTQGKLGAFDLFYIFVIYHYTQQEICIIQTHYVKEIVITKSFYFVAIVPIIQHYYWMSQTFVLESCIGSCTQIQYMNIVCVVSFVMLLCIYYDRLLTTFVIRLDVMVNRALYQLYHHIKMVIPGLCQTSALSYFFCIEQAN